MNKRSKNNILYHLENIQTDLLDILNCDNVSEYIKEDDLETLSSTIDTIEDILGYNNIDEAE